MCRAALLEMLSEEPAELPPTVQHSRVLQGDNTCSFVCTHKLDFHPFGLKTDGISVEKRRKSDYSPHCVPVNLPGVPCTKENRQGDEAFAPGPFLLSGIRFVSILGF